MGIRPLSPHFCNSAILQTTKSIAELRTKKLRNCDCGPSKFDFRNSASLRSLLAAPLLSSPFSSAQDGFKNQLKIFLELSISLETKTCLKGTVAQYFSPLIFFSWIDQIPHPKICRKLRKWSSQVANFRKNSNLRIVDLRLQSTFLAEWRLRKCFLQVTELRCADSKKSCTCPPLVIRGQQKVT
jgi:hypothetical protein